MINLEKTEIFGWETAIRGMRNPMNSWDKSDSDCTSCMNKNKNRDCESCFIYIGENDLNLMKILSRAGTDHSKFLRMVNVTVDITAPLYWWKEFDTYKVGTVANSCSTMHKIQSKPIELSDFSTEEFDFPDDYSISFNDCMLNVIADCEQLRQLFVSTGEKKYWRGLIQLLPSSYNQKRTIQLNYQVLRAMYFARRNHKLDEWHEFCYWCETLPYFKEICIENN